MPEKFHVTSVTEFKSSRAKLLTLPGVTSCLNSWKFVRVQFELLTSLEKICSKSNFPADIYRFEAKLAKSRFDDIAYVFVNSSMTLTLISTCVRFPAKILLHCLKNIYLLIHLFIKSCLHETQGRILLFYFIYKLLFPLPSNTFYPITLFYVAWISITLLLHCI